MQLLSNRTRTRPAMVAAGIAALLALQSTAGVRAQSEPQTLYACANPAGQPRFVAATEPCRPQETRFAWKAVGPSERTGQIPNMLGVWKGLSSGYGFENTADDSCGHRPDADIPDRCKPHYFSDDEEASITVTEQTGEAFAGIWSHCGDTCIATPTTPIRYLVERVLGVVSSDGTVSFQAFEPTELRAFATGTVRPFNGTLEMVGQGHFFDDFGLRPFPIACVQVPVSPSNPTGLSCPPAWWNLQANPAGQMTSGHFRWVKQP